MKYLLLFLVLFLPTTNVSAQQENITIQVCELQATTLTNNVFLRPCEEWISRNNCPANNFVMWDVTAFQGQTMYQTAQAALLANREITIRTDGTSCGPFDRIVLIRLAASQE